MQPPNQLPNPGPDQRECRELWDNLALGFSTAFQLRNLLFCLVGVALIMYAPRPA